MTWRSWFNRATEDDAENALLACCASHAWAHAVVERRPFATPDELLAVAEEEWWRLPPLEWLHAFAAHPRIGERHGERQQNGAGTVWSAQEQSAAAEASIDTRQQLIEVNRAYEENFGHIYIVAAAGKSADQLLRDARSRLTNDADTELRTAAAEQARITSARLQRLLAQDAPA